MPDRLLHRLETGSRSRQGSLAGTLGSPAIDRRRVDDCLRALGVVVATLLASLLLLLLLALATPEGLSGVRLAEAATAATEISVDPTLSG